MEHCKGFSDWLMCLKCEHLSGRACPIERDNAMDIFIQGTLGQWTLGQGGQGGLGNRGSVMNQPPQVLDSYAGPVRYMAKPIYFNYVVNLKRGRK